MLRRELPFRLDDLLHHRTVEGNRIEFKATWNDLIAEAVVRSACAFANDMLNLNGGYIVLGVEEHEGHAVLPPRGLGAMDLDVLQKKVRAECLRIEPAYQPILSIEHVGDRPLLVIWCPGGDNRPYQSPDGKGGKAFFVRQGPQTVKAQGETFRQLMELAAKIPFDDRRNLEARVEDLSPTLVRRFLHEVGSGLLEESTDDRDLYRRMRIVAPVNGHEVPRNVGLLFFHDSPEQFFPAARIDVVRFADEAGGDVMEERIFRGPVQDQLRAVLLHLGSMIGEIVLKPPGQPEALRIAAYPTDGLREVVTNAVYHRGYDGAYEPTKVYIYPDRIEVTSYPGPMPGLHLQDLQPGRSIPSIPARNRRIGDLLKELRLAEARGTGIPKIQRRMKENGSPLALFRFDEDRTFFATLLPISPRYLLHRTWIDTKDEALEGEKQQTVLRVLRLLPPLTSSSDLLAAGDLYLRSGELVEGIGLLEEAQRRQRMDATAYLLARGKNRMANAERGNLRTQLRCEAMEHLEQAIALTSDPKSLALYWEVLTVVMADLRLDTAAIEAAFEQTAHYIGLGWPGDSFRVLLGPRKLRNFWAWGDSIWKEHARKVLSA